MNSRRLLPALAFLACACATTLRAENPAANEPGELVPVDPGTTLAPAASATPALAAEGAPLPAPDGYPPSPIAPGTTIVAVGSSTTYGLDFSHQTHQTYLEQFCRLPGIHGRVGIAENQGVSGSGLDLAVQHYTGAWNDGPIHHAAVKSFAPKKTGIPAWIFLWVGSNDFYTPDFALGPYMAKYKAYVAQAHADGFKVAAATLTPRGNNTLVTAKPDPAFLHDANRLALNREISRFNPFFDGPACPDVVVRLDLALNDAADQGVEPAQRGLYGPGFLHPNQLGYSWVARAWYQALVLNGSPYAPGVALTAQPNDFAQPQTFQPTELECASGAGWYRVATFDFGQRRAQTPKHFQLAAYTGDNTARNNFELLVAGCDGLSGTLNTVLTILNAKNSGHGPLATQVRVSSTPDHRVGVDLYLGQSGYVAVLQGTDAAVARTVLFNPADLGNPASLAIPATGFASTSGIAGTATGVEAAPGAVGEYLAAIVAPAQAVPAAANAPTEVAHLDLPPGDWDVTGVADFHVEQAAPPGLVQAGSSATAGNFGPQDSFVAAMAALTPTFDMAQAIPTVRYRFGAAATIRLVVKCGSPAAAYGTLRARRVR